jgi:hypothetical protein
VFEELVPLTSSTSSASSKSETAVKAETSSASSAANPMSSQHSRSDRFKFKAGKRSDSRSSRSTASSYSISDPDSIPQPRPPVIDESLEETVQKSLRGSPFLDEVSPPPVEPFEPAPPGPTQVVENSDPAADPATAPPSAAPTKPATYSKEGNLNPTLVEEQPPPTFSSTTLVFVAAGLMVGFYIWSRQSAGAAQGTTSSSAPVKYAPLPTREGETRRSMQGAAPAAMNPLEDEFGDEDFESDFDLEEGVSREKTVQLTAHTAARPPYKAPEDEWRDDLSDSGPGQEDGWTSDDNQQPPPHAAPPSPLVGHISTSIPSLNPHSSHSQPPPRLPIAPVPRSFPKPQSPPATDDIFAVSLLPPSSSSHLSLILSSRSAWGRPRHSRRRSQSPLPPEARHPPPVSRCR